MKSKMIASLMILLISPSLFAKAGAVGKINMADPNLEGQRYAPAASSAVKYGVPLARANADALGLPVNPAKFGVPSENDVLENAFPNQSIYGYPGSTNPDSSSSPGAGGTVKSTK